MSNKNQNFNQKKEDLKEQREAAENAKTAESHEKDTQETQDTAEEEEEKELTAEEKLEKELEKAQKIIDEQKDKYLRLSAEFDNFRKRTIKEKAELIKNGGEKTICAVLPILDDFERALQNIQKAEDIKAVAEGVDLIFQKFQKVLAQEGLKEMKPVGETFDTDFHEAVALVPAPNEEQKGKVLDCVQTGYKLNDKVIRHAKVVVAQ